MFMQLEKLNFECKIVNVSVDEKIMKDDEVDIEKIEAIFLIHTLMDIIKNDFSEGFKLK